MLFLILLVALASHAQADTFSSIAHLRNQLHLERHLVYALQDYIVRTQSKINQVNRYLDQYFDSYRALSDEILSDDLSLVGNPLQAYHLVRRLAEDWPRTRKAIAGDDWEPIRLLEGEYQHLLPSKDDVEGAEMALFRLQNAYALDMNQLAMGDILGVPQHTTLSARELLNIGERALRNGYNANGILWMEEALRQAHSEGNTTANVTDIMEDYTAAIDKHDELFERTDINIKNYHTFDHPVKGNSSHRSLYGSKKVAQLGRDISEEDVSRNYNALCRGERLISVADESRLSCRLDTRGRHPLLLLQPLKVEEKGLEPGVVQIYDVLTPSQTDILRQIAEPKLKRSTIWENGKRVVSKVRTSQNAWIRLRDHPVMQNILSWVDAATGLSTDADKKHVESVQVANYGMGGLYAPHHDYLYANLTPEEMQARDQEALVLGDRTATLMFYLSDVTRGGATVFPKAGLSVWPKKGSAVLWYNLKRSGEGDIMTLHGACPVAVGSKWIANFWIHEIGQTFRRRCALNPDL